MTHSSADQSDVVAHESPNGAVSTRSYLPDDEPPPPPLPRVSRRRLPVATLVLALLAVGAAGFFIGVKVEKTKFPASNTAATTAARQAAAGFGTGTTPGALPTGANATQSPAVPSGAAGGATGGGGGGAATTSGAANIIGTVTVVDGSTLYVTDTAGDTVKVTTNSGTTITKTTTGLVKDLAPGQSVVIRGVQSSAGVYAAQTVTQGAAGGFAGGFGGGRGTRPGATAAPSPAAGNG